MHKSIPLAPELSISLWLLVDLLYLPPGLPTCVLFLKRGDDEPRSPSRSNLGWVWGGKVIRGGGWGPATPAKGTAFVIFSFPPKALARLWQGISSVTTGCCSCEPLYPVAVEIHWEISREIVQNAVVGLILTLATAGAKTSGKDQILLVSCCQVLEKSRLHPRQAWFWDGKPMPSQAQLGPLEAFVCLWQFHTPPCLLQRGLESFLGEQSPWWGMQHLCDEPNAFFFKQFNRHLFLKEKKKKTTTKKLYYITRHT